MEYRGRSNAVPAQPEIEKEKRKKNKVSSPQAGGPSRKESGFKQVDRLQALGYYRIMKLNKLIKKINKENAPPGGWKPEDDIKKAINWDKLKDPKVLKQLEKIFKDA